MSYDIKYEETIFTSILLLFFIQIFSDFVESTYILSLMTTSLNENTLAVLFFFSGIVLVLFKDEVPKSFTFAIGFIFIAFRLLEPFFETQGKMIISGIGLGCFIIFFPIFLRLKGKSRSEDEVSFNLTLSLAIAILLSIFFRTSNSSADLSTSGFFQLIGWVLGAVAIIMLYLFVNNELEKKMVSSLTEKEGSNNHVILNIIGLSSIIFYIYFAFSAPITIVRWTGGNYLLITSIIGFMTLIFILILTLKPKILETLTLKAILAINIVFILSVVLTIFINQIQFGFISRGSYPYEASLFNITSYVPILLMIFLYPIILVDFMIIIHNLTKSFRGLSVRSVGKKFSIGFSLYTVIMIFAFIFTTVWGFIPAIGSFFRDLFWFIFFIIGLSLFIALFKSSMSMPSFDQLSFNQKKGKIINFFVILILLGTITGLILVESSPPPHDNNKTTIRFLTYNIQQGVDEFANKNYDGQIELIKKIDADIIGLQETDKLAGNSDPVLYFANKLNMYSYFGPNTVTGTTGVSLLSKYPIQNAKTFYHLSENVDKKQTATIELEVIINNKLFTVYVTHTFGRMSAKTLLQADVLNLATGKDNVVFMGDFNFQPFSQAYNLTTQFLDDSWFVKWPSGSDNTGYNNSVNIDHIFVSPGMNVVESKYDFDPQSDHPAYWIDINI